jgi:hypothetical protein
MRRGALRAPCLHWQGGWAPTDRLTFNRAARGERARAARPYV